MDITSIATIKPKYLGCKPGGKEHYFFSLKEGFGRFIKYVAYPYWCRSSDVPDILDVSSILEKELVEEVSSFTSGKLHISVIPKKRGRSEKIIKTKIGADDNAGNVGVHSSKTGREPGNSIAITPGYPGGKSDDGRDLCSKPDIRRSDATGSRRPSKLPKTLSGGTGRVFIEPKLNQKKIQKLQGERDEVKTIGLSSTGVAVKPKRKRRTKKEMEDGR